MQHEGEHQTLFCVFVFMKALQQTGNLSSVHPASRPVTVGIRFNDNDKDKDGCVHKIIVIVFANVHHSCFSASCVGLQVLSINCDTLTQSH